MFSTKLSVVPANLPSGAALLACVILLSACSSTVKDPTAGWSPNKIYAEAKDEAQSGAYDKAIPLFEKLEGRAAGTPLAQQAQLAYPIPVTIVPGGLADEAIDTLA